MKLSSMLSCKRMLKYNYQIPNEYQQSFYLANASLFQIVNYFIHGAYQTIFPDLVTKLKDVRGTDYEEATTLVKDYIKQIEYCDQFLDFHFPVKRWHGAKEIVRGMRAYHGLMQNYGTTLGGFRLIKDLNRHTTQGFAVFGTYRNACYNLNYSGAHGGLKICAEVYEPDELREAITTFMCKLKEYHGVTDIMEPDLYCSVDTIKYMNSVSDEKILVMGKPEDEGGIKNYYLSGAKAVMYILKMFMDNEDITKRVEITGGLRDKTFMIQGLGRMGKELAKQLVNSGCSCVGVREHNCSIYDPAGLNVKALLKHYNKFGNIINFSPKSKESEVNQFFGENCDILILAAVERAVNCHSADHLKAKIIVEACNGPVTPTAHKIVLSKSKLLIPSILASGGYSVMSFIEHTKNTGTEVKDENEMFETILKDTTKEIMNIENDLKLNLDFRRAAYIKAIRKIFKNLICSESLMKPIKDLEWVQ